MCEKYLYGSEGGAGNDRPYPYLRAKEISRSFLSARRRGGRLNSKANSLLNLVDHPVRSRQGGFAAFLLVAATPPDPGGEFPRLRMDFLCKAHQPAPGLLKRERRGGALESGGRGL
jgi:hypothetical protein